MASNEELSVFLKEGLARGLPREDLEEVLLETGWPPEQVRGALGAFADVTFPVRAAQQEGGMEGRHELRAPVVEDLAAES